MLYPVGEDCSEREQQCASGAHQETSRSTSLTSAGTWRDCGGSYGITHRERFPDRSPNSLARWPPGRRDIPFVAFRFCRENRSKHDHAVAETELSVGDRPILAGRSEEHTSELQSHHDLVCRLLLE